MLDTSSYSAAEGSHYKGIGKDKAKIIWTKIVVKIS
jgi:hypothetical protein